MIIYDDHEVELGLDYLEHYGVKGMKWGKRKARYKKGVKKLRRAATKPRTKRAKERAKVEKELSRLSDRELQERLNRLRNEDAYRQLKGASKRRSAFRDSVGNKLREGASQAVTNGATAVMTAGATAVLVYGANRVAGTNNPTVSSGARWVAKTVATKRKK